MDNQELRNDEITALSAIFPEEWVVEDKHNTIFSIILYSTTDSKRNSPLKLKFRLKPGYPNEDKPVITLSAPWMSRDTKANLITGLESICDQNLGQSVLYMLIEKAKDTLNDIVPECEVSDAQTDFDARRNYEEPVLIDQPEISKIKICHGEPIVDRKSTFQAHLAEVHSVSEVTSVLSQLKENKKIAMATHNILAYRIVDSESGIVRHDCDDDGETAAGSRLLHLLEIVDANNVLVVVSRWYGGIQLGPDRFKHIKNAARELLARCNYIDQ